tara:strand:+ start:753 stop:1244 length:492 start_codon:yes stop_codon:yes gene_type:complete
MDNNEREETAPYWFNSSSELAFTRWEQHRSYCLTEGQSYQGQDTVMMHLKHAINVPPNSAGARMYFRTCLPYCINKVGMVLNREYKPIGIGGGSSRNWVDYELFSLTHIMPDHNRKDFLWFYDDGNVPWHSVKCRRDYMYRVIKYFAPSALDFMKANSHSGRM